MAIDWKQLKKRVLVRGESAVASVGIAGAAILLAALAACGWWSLQAARQAQTQARTEEVRMVGTLLAKTAESMLANDELSPLRRLIMEASHNYRLSRCRIVLGEDQVIADAEPSHINVRTLPVSWTAGPQEAAAAGDPTKTFQSYPLKVDGRGGARLEVAASLVDRRFAMWEMQTGIALIGAVALCTLLLVYRRLRGRLVAVGAVREALLALTIGDTSPQSLVIDPKLGAEAAAWNGLLSDQEKLRKQAVAERTIDRLDARRGVKSDSDAAWDAIPQGLVLVNGDMTVKAANGAAAVLLKRRREEIPGSSIGETIKDEKVLEVIASIATGATQRPIILDVERPGADSTVIVLRFSVRPVRKEDTASAMLVIEDITQQRIAEQARNSFIAQVTHELRTPLTNIRLYVETAIDDGEENPAVRSNCLNVINLESRRLERIVSEMLSVAEIEAGSFKVRRDDVAMDVMLDELKADYAAQAEEKEIKLTFTRLPKLPKLQGDRDKIALALHNLIGNALKYTPGGGKVTVNTDVRDGQLVIEVSDTGFGIKPDEADKIFDKFYRSSDPRVGKITGTGLGLTLAREVIRMHGGDITLQSEIDKGSLFTATLPVPPEAG